MFLILLLGNIHHSSHPRLLKNRTFFYIWIPASPTLFNFSQHNIASKWINYCVLFNNQTIVHKVLKHKVFGSRSYIYNETTCVVTSLQHWRQCVCTVHNTWTLERASSKNALDLSINSISSASFKLNFFSMTYSETSRAFISVYVRLYCTLGLYWW